jgi:hypothetical protein
MRVNLPAASVGPCELTLQYAVPVAGMKPCEPSVLSVPLPMPADGELTGNRLVVKAARNTSVSPRGVGWTIADRTSAGLREQAVWQLTAAKRMDRIDLDLRTEGGDATAAATVDRVWIQTWLTAPERQDLAVYQFTTNRKEWEVVFPAGATPDPEAVFVNGKRIEGCAVAEDRLLVPLSAGGEYRRFVVELRYHFSGPRPPRGAMCLEFPRLNSGTHVWRMYWQLILPANEHLMTNPAGFTGEFTWGWQDYAWGRQPLLDQAQLEAWSGATLRTTLPERSNLYLLSTAGDADQAELRTVGRTSIVLWASGMALVAGLLLIYVPAARHPAVLLTAGIAILAAGLVAPEPTLLLAQGASLGVGLTLLAGFLERSLSSRRRFPVRKETASALVGATSTHSALRPLLVDGHATTETAPAIVVAAPPGKVER